MFGRVELGKTSGVVVGGSYQGIPRELAGDALEEDDGINEVMLIFLFVLSHFSFRLRCVSGVCQGIQTIVDEMLSRFSGAPMISVI